MEPLEGIDLLALTFAETNLPPHIKAAKSAILKRVNALHENITAHHRDIEHFKRQIKHSEKQAEQSAAKLTPFVTGDWDSIDLGFSAHFDD